MLDAVTDGGQPGTSHRCGASFEGMSQAADLVLIGVPRSHLQLRQQISCLNQIELEDLAHQNAVLITQLAAQFLDDV
jgi:hypothetical protein